MYNLLNLFWIWMFNCILLLIYLYVFISYCNDNILIDSNDEYEWLVDTDEFDFILCDNINVFFIKNEN